MLKFLLAYVGTALVFLVADGLWLSTAAASIYRTRISGVFAENVYWPGAIAFYLLYVVGLVVFGVAPAFESGRWHTALMWGGAFGFFCYATYDLTNLATIRGWSLTVTLVDIAWGTVLSAVASAGGYLAARTALKLGGLAQ